MTYETSNKEATKFVKSGIWTDAVSQKLELQFGALDRSTILTLSEEGQHLLFMFFICHIDLLYSFAHFEPNLNIFWHISYASWYRIFP
mgnify:CR=1 FL=1